MKLRVDVIPNRKSHPQVLVRTSWKAGTKVVHKTVRNRTKMPPEVV